MKACLLSFVISFAFLKGYTQIQADSDLSNMLQNKKRFSEIKQIVNTYLYNKLTTYSDRDTLAKNKVLRQLKTWNRKFWISENYTDSKGEVVNIPELVYEAYTQQKQEASRLQMISPLAQAQPWLLQGPYNSDNGIGRMDKLVFHPTDPNTIYAGAPYGGLFRTTDGGVNWFPISSYLPSLGVSGIAINSLNPLVVYVLSGDGNSGGGCFSPAPNVCLRFGEEVSTSLGVFKSIDGGINWHRTASFPTATTASFQGRDLVIDPNNPETLLAATSVGLFRTTNGGSTWNQVSSPFPDSNFWQIKFKPGSPNTVYATGNNFFIVSSDNGASFTSIPDLSTNSNLFAATRISIGVTVVNPNRVVLFAGPMTGSGSFTGFFSSNNSGQSFLRLAQTPNLFASTIGNEVLTDQSTFNNCVTVSPINENQILVGGLSIWVSQDGGTSWNQNTAYWPSDAPYVHPDVHSINFNPLNNNLYCATDGGVYLFTGPTWIPLFNGATTSQFYRFEKENNERVTWGGTQDNGILKQQSGGTYFMYRTGDGFDLMTDHNYLVADGEAENTYYSINQTVFKDGASYKNITPPNSMGFFANLAMSPDLKNKIYAGYSNATYMSFDAGDSWVSLGNTPGNWSISTCPSNTDFIYVAGSGVNKISKRQISGGWTNLTPSLIAAGYDNIQKITDIEVHPTNHNIVYISIGGAVSTAKLFRTVDGGNNWENLSFNLPNVPVFSLKRDNNDGIYAGTSIGVYYKRSGVNTWELFSNGLPPVPITEIELFPASNQVWVSTYGRGIWFTNPYSTCLPNLNLTGEISGNIYMEASNNINSNQSILGGEGTFVRYNATNQIRLTPGFNAKPGSKFKTFRTGCGGQVDLFYNKQNIDSSSTPSPLKNKNSQKN